MKIVPDEEMMYNGRKVRYLVCEPTEQDKEERKQKLRDNMPDNKKPVKAVDLGGNVTFYNSVAEASVKTGTTYSSISKCLRKRQKTAGGFRWFYTEKGK